MALKDAMEKSEPRAKVLDHEDPGSEATDTSEGAGLGLKSHRKRCHRK